MAQKITLKIAGRDFNHDASSPEVESSMRIAAEDINKLMARYDERYPQKSFDEKLLFVTLTETVARVVAQRKVNAMADAEQKLSTGLKAYLAGIENNR